MNKENNQKRPQNRQKQPLQSVDLKIPESQEKKTKSRFQQGAPAQNQNKETDKFDRQLTSIKLTEASLRLLALKEIIHDFDFS
jgi:hypothetical protein